MTSGSNPAFGALFAPHATIATHTERGVEITSPAAFVRPRIALLTSAKHGASRHSRGETTFAASKMSETHGRP